MKRISLSIVVAAALSQSAFAGDKIGGGADVLVCKKPGQPKTYQLLDVVESAKALRPIDLGEAKTIEEKIDLMTARLAELDPVRAARYRIEAIKIHEDLTAQEQGKAPQHNLAIFEKDKLKDYDDSNESFEIPNCEKHQLVQQKDTLSNLDHVYNFQKDYWLKLDADNRVATYFHEAIYREFRTLGHTNSLYVRHLNSWMFSGRIETVGPCDYLNLADRVGIKSVLLFGTIAVGTSGERGGLTKCDADREIESLNGIDGYIPFPGVALKLDLASVTIKNRKLIQGTVRSTFDHQNGILTPTEFNKYRISGGTVYFENEQLRFEKMRKDPAWTEEHGYYRPSVGMISFVVGPDLVLKEIDETGIYKKEMSLSAETEKAAIEWFTCARDYLQSKRVPQNAPLSVNDQYQALKTAAANENIEKIKQLTEDCKKLPRLPARSNKYEQYYFMQDVLNERLWALAFPSARHCEGNGGMFNAALIVGISIGFHKMTCEWNDGSVRVHKGPIIAFRPIAIGASVEVGPFSYDDEFSRLMTDLNGKDASFETSEKFNMVFGYKSPKAVKRRMIRYAKRKNVPIEEVEQGKHTGMLWTDIETGLKTHAFGFEKGTHKLGGSLVTKTKHLHDDWSAWLKQLPQGEIVQYTGETK